MLEKRCQIGIKTIQVVHGHLDLVVKFQLIDRQRGVCRIKLTTLNTGIVLMAYDFFSI